MKVSMPLNSKCETKLFYRFMYQQTIDTLNSNNKSFISVHLKVFHYDLTGI